MSTHRSIVARVQSIVHLGASTNSSRRISTQSLVIKGTAIEIRGEMMSSMMSEKMKLSRDLSQLMISRDKIQLVEVIDSKLRSEHQNNRCHIEHSSTSSHN